jgi:hypothetical protein
LRLQQRQLHQRLCAAVLLLLLGKLVAAPEREAWRHLAAYELEAPGPTGAGDNNDDEAAAISSTGAADDRVAAALAQMQRRHGQQRGAAGGAARPAEVAEAEVVVEAEVQDGDDEAYEDIEPPPCPGVLGPNGLGRGAPGGSLGWGGQAEAACERDYEWPALRGRLLDLGSRLDYSVLSDGGVWVPSSSDGGGAGAGAELFGLLRALGVHPRADELAPLQHSAVAVVVERVAAEPHEMQLLPQLWEALGVAGAAGAAAGSGGPLSAEALAALGAAAALRQRLPGAGARGRLRAAVHAHLLPLMERSLELLGYGHGGGGGGLLKATPGPGAGGAEGERLAQALVLSYLCEAYVLDRPRGCDAGAALASSGVLRSLVQLFVAHAATPAAEPIRWGGGRIGWYCAE